MDGCWPRTPLKAAGWPQGWDSQTLLLAFAGRGENGEGKFDMDSDSPPSLAL